MALWGVVVTPNCPVIHPGGSGRLRISQAIVASDLGMGGRTVLQCKVGDKASFSICTLYPGKVDSVYLNLELEEIDDVVFSIRDLYFGFGFPADIHLSGYYIR